MTARSRSGFAAVACGAIALVFVLTARFFAQGSPNIEETPGWAYGVLDKGSVDMMVIAVAGAAVALLVRKALTAGTPPRAAIACTVGASLALQTIQGLLDREQIHGWTQRFFGESHGLYTAAMKHVPDAIAALRDYEHLVRTSQFTAFALSKPPGTVAVYLIIDRLSRLAWVRTLMKPFAALVAQDLGIAREDLTLCALTIVLLALFSALTAWPLARAARFALPGVPSRMWIYGALLFVTVPSIQVMSVHLDSTLFPCLTATALALAIAAVRPPAGGRRFAFGLGGMAAATSLAAVYCSYGLLAVPLITFGVLVARWLELRYVREGRDEEGLAACTGFLAGALVTLAILVLLFKWAPVQGYHRAVVNHRGWRPSPPNWQRGTAIFEFSYFAGFPLMAAYAVSVVVAAGSLVRAAIQWLRTRTLPAGFALAALAVASALLMVAMSVAIGSPESARLWLFLLPWLCLSVLWLLTRPALRRIGPPAATTLIVSQALLILFLKNFQSW